MPDAGDAVASLGNPRRLVDSALEWLRGSSCAVGVLRKVVALDTELADESSFSPRKPKRLLEEWPGGSTPA